MWSLALRLHGEEGEERGKEEEDDEKEIHDSTDDTCDMEGEKENC